jgi:hypothetical protein
VGESVSAAVAGETREQFNERVRVNADRERAYEEAHSLTQREWSEYFAATEALDRAQGMTTDMRKAWVKEGTRVAAFKLANALENEAFCWRRWVDATKKMGGA